MDRNRTIELLAPAGSIESVRAAINAGADAVYMGGAKFGARAFAKSVTQDSLAKAIDLVHLHGKKLFLTLNTLLKQKEMEEELIAYLAPYVYQGLDGVIVQDFGIFAVLKKYFPNLPIHTSTQMMVTGLDSAKLLKEAGAVRVVAARELNLTELANIYKETGMELEAFIHGAVCYCYSGQCLYSSLIGGRSGNRGQCAQPCRLPYTVFEKDKPLNSKKDAWVMSLKDMCTLEYLPQMIETGVMSFKIEGRMKSPLYTAGVVSVYRKYIDLYRKVGREKYKVEKKDLDILAELFDRGGFSSHYLVGHNAKEMIACEEKKDFRAAKEKIRKEIEEKYLLKDLQENLRGKLMISTDSFAKLTVNYKDYKVSVTSEQVVEKAKKLPLSLKDVKKQMSKTGGSLYQWQDLQIELDEDAFLSVKQLNTLRRDAFLTLSETVLQSFKRKNQIEEDVLKKTQKEIRKQTQAKISVSLERVEYLPLVLSYPQIDTIILTVENLELKNLSLSVKQCHQAEKKCLLAMPVVFRKPAILEFEQNWNLIEQSGVDGLVIENLDEAGWLKQKNWPLPVLFDHRMYAFNHFAGDWIKNLVIPKNKLLALTAPLELSAKEIVEANLEPLELVVYGRAPMMVSANCIRLTTSSCAKNKKDKDILWILDRKHQKFPVKNICKYCYNMIYNSLPLSLHDRTKKIETINPDTVRLSFTFETKEEMKEVLDLFTQILNGGEMKNLSIPFTRGHFTKGIQ